MRNRRHADACCRCITRNAVGYTDRTLTALAWCCLRQGFRMFRLDRLQRADATGTSFRPRRVALLREYLKQLEKERNSADP